jgi:quinol-cytochrome oxidoreductase complex cytochrome b subunit
MATARNVGSTDSWVRLVIGVIFLLLLIFTSVAGTLKILFVIIAAIGIGTGVIKFCPLYRVLGISTCEK